MNEWMNERMNEWINEWMDGTNEWIDDINERANGQTNEDVWKISFLETLYTFFFHEYFCSIDFLNF